MTTFKPMWTACLLAAGALLVYAPYLDHAPIYLAHDEVIFGLNAHSIAWTGRDPVGRFLPLYVGHSWQPPLTIYLTAMFLRLAPLSETVLRMPSVAVGVLNVVLIYFLARRIFKGERLAIMAAALLALTPAHFLHSRLAVEDVYPLPFMLVWLLCLLAFLEPNPAGKPRLSLLFVATVSLGVGIYSYLASVIMMPVFFLVTCVVLAMSGEKSVRTYLVATVGFVLPIIPLIPWHLTHPAQVPAQFSAYGLYDPARGSPLRGLARLFSYQSISERAGVYYNFFNPSLLFFTGDVSIVNSTRQAGVFLLPVAALVPLGIHRLVTLRPRPVWVLLVGGLALSPLAAVLIGEVLINRALFMIPFVVLIATYGLDRLLSAGRRARFVAACLLAVMVVQFGVFYRDYMTDYRVRSCKWFERNIRGAIEEIIARDTQEPVPTVSLSREITWIDFYWRLYLIKYHREDLLARTVYFDPKHDDVQALPWRSLLLMNFDQARNDPLVRAGKLLDLQLILEPDLTPSFSLFARN